jgi:hypothetical protein
MLNKQSYETALGYLRGNILMQPIFQELKYFIEKEYNIKVLGFLLDHITFLPEKPYRLSVLLLSQKDQDKMMLNDPKIYGFDPIKQNQVLNKFKELNEKYVFLSKNKAENCFVIFTDLGTEIRIDINHRTKRDVAEFLKSTYKHLNIWRVDSLLEVIYIFFKKNKELEMYREEGELENIRKSYLSFIEKYDEFKVYQVNDLSMEFTSKEIIDEYFEGNVSLFFRTR